jgi:transposase-like protein
MDFANLKELIAHLPNEKTCRKHFERLRWGGKPICPHCKHDKVYRIENGKRYKCANSACYKKFSVTVGTAFENTKIPLSTWIIATYLVTAHKKGINALQMSKHLGVTHKTAWFMIHRIRESFKERAPELLEGTVECDETFYGGRNKNRHYDKKVPQSQGRSFKDKTPVLGMLERGGKLRTVVVKNTSGKVIKPIIHKNVKKGSILYSDEWHAYRGLGYVYQHSIVDHGRKQYKNGAACTNSIEGAWCHLKKLLSNHNCVSKKHLQRYCNEFTFKYNTRGISDNERFLLSLRNIEGHRLRYDDLIAA